MTKIICLFLVTLLFCGCSHSLVLPREVDINKIEVIDQQDPQRRDDVSRVSSVITDRSRIGSVIDFLHRHNTFCYGETGTFPSTRFSAILYRNDEPKVILWVGDGWIGARNGGEDRRDNRQQSISNDESRHLHQILGIETTGTE